MLGVCRSIPVREGVDRHRFVAEILPQAHPVVMRGLIEDWPLVVAGRGGSDALLTYLRTLDAPQPVEAFLGQPDMGGRFFYSDDLTGFNFERIRLSFTDLLSWLAPQRGEGAPYLYAGAIPAPTHLPQLLADATMPLLPPETERLTSLWLGNRTRTAAHWDLPQNLACVVGGRRRFILFPPEQIDNLYPGPFDFTLAGQPVSMVDFHAPDHARYPRFAEAVRHGMVAELGPGDVLYIPSLWWHHVESLDDVGALVNFWWREGPEWLTTPSYTLLHALLTLRDLPATERSAWRAFFDHYIFRPDAVEGEDPMAHLPPSARGLFAPMSREVERRLKATLARPLTR